MSDTDQAGDFFVSAAVRTDCGLIRPQNEDFVLAGNLDAEGEGSHSDSSDVETFEIGHRGPLFVVCDGMGGTAGGAVASRIAAQVMWSEMASSQPTTDARVHARLLRRAVRKANRRVREESLREEDLAGMGTTLSAAGTAGSTLVVAQVGDSRAYVLRKGKLVQVTRDQSVVSALVSSGELSETQARLSDQRSLILQAIGADPDVDVSLSVVDLVRGDRVLLCSDGLHSVATDAAIRLGLGLDAPGPTADRLIALAKQGGAPDNVTVIVADFSGDALPSDSAGELQFTELDPAEVGDRAVTHTSRVARRLAARAGLGNIDAGPIPLPATGQYPAITSEPASGPAERELETRSHLPSMVYVVAAVAAVLGLIWLFLG